jgi:lactoylglutathione lyase
MTEARKARAMGFNHIALEVGDIEDALAFYGRLFDFELRDKSDTAAFIDLGDQFLALQKGRSQPADEGRHFDWLSTTRMQSAQLWPKRVSNRCPARFLIFSTRGAIA